MNGAIDCLHEIKNRTSIQFREVSPTMCVYNSIYPTKKKFCVNSKDFLTQTIVICESFHVYGPSL